MSQQTENAFLKTRLRLFSGQLIPFETLGEMVRLDQEQIVQELSQYNDVVDVDASIKQIEQQLCQAMFSDFKILLRPWHGNYFRFLKQSLRWFELVNLKVLIRGKFTGVTENRLTEQLINLGEFADLPVRQLVETDDPFEMLRLLENTAYGSIVRRARRVFEDQGQELFSLDSAIDRNFFLELAHRARFLDLQDQSLLKEVYGVLMDRFNLLWLMRYRFSYGLSPAKSYYLLTATGSQLHSVELMNLAKKESLDEVIAALPDKYRAMLADLDSIYQVEQVMELYSLSACRRCLAQSHSLMSQTLAYLILRDAETRYLLAILKGKQLGFDQELIEQSIGVLSA